jgi:hypothetical protein
MLQATPQGFYTHFWYSMVELDHLGTRLKDAKTARPSIAKIGTTQDLQML